MISNKSDIGKIGENRAVNYLKNKHILPLSTNYKSRYGEIDIIGHNDKYIVFVEVKTRKRVSVISGVECVSRKKQERIIKTACIFMQEKNINKQPRFDIIEIKNDSLGSPLTIKHIENAFTAEGKYAFF